MSSHSLVYGFDNYTQTGVFTTNAFNNGEFGFNNLQQLVGTWTHKFSDKVYTATEALYMFMNDATTHPTAEVPFQNGSFPVKPGYAPEWGILNYTMWRIAPAAFLTFRNEFYNDTVGSRTGHATKYSEHSIGVTWLPNKIVTVRPEVRFDRSYDTAAFNNGTCRNQFVFSTDFIIHF